jgi:hypothetical protein
MSQFQTNNSPSLVVVGDYPTHVWPGQWLNPAFKVEMAHVEHYANFYQMDTGRLYATVTCHWMNPENLDHEEIKRGDLQGQKLVYAAVTGDFARFTFDHLKFKMTAGGFYYFEVDVYFRRGQTENQLPGHDIHVDWTNEMINRRIYVEKVMHAEPGFI